MKAGTKVGLFWAGAIVGWLLQSVQGWSYEITEDFAMGGVLAGIIQYQDISHAPGFESEGRGLLAFQPTLDYTPTKTDEIFAKFGFGAGNGLMDAGQSPFVLAPWGGDTQDAVKDINGRNRDYLLTVWYKHTFAFGDDNGLGLTGGIIDATDYLDVNAFANDEYNQFLNQTFVNGPNSFVPSYDIGGVFEWEMSGFSLIGAAMAVGSNGEEGALDEPYNFYGIHFGYTLQSIWGRETTGCCWIPRVAVSPARREMKKSG